MIYELLCFCNKMNITEVSDLSLSYSRKGCTNTREESLNSLAKKRDLLILVHISDKAQRR